MPQKNFKSGPQNLKEFDELTSMQQTFVMRFMENGHNATEAHRHTGYRQSPRKSINRRKAYDLRHNRNIDYNIRRLMREKWESQIMSEEEALARTAEVGRFDVGDYLYEYPANCPHCDHLLDEGGLVGFDLEKAKRDGATGLIKDVTPTRYGNKYTFYSAEEARRDIMKANDTFVTKPETQVGGLAALLHSVGKANLNGKEPDLLDE